MVNTFGISCLEADVRRIPHVPFGPPGQLFTNVGALAEAVVGHP